MDRRMPNENDSDQETMQLREEELLARKEQVQTGQVQLGKEVVSQERTIQVPVTREEVVLERHAVDRRPADQAIDNSDQTISVPLHEEQVKVEKRPFVYEEIGVGKRLVDETQQVSGTVRREEARIERDGNLDVRSDER